ncbi:MAG: hypothetical protein HQK65_08305, partial [Desulfamplus sp.]|nr:hypothetical protein [Desulfamplus sp.]
SSRMTGRADTAIDFLLSDDPDQISASYDLLDKHNRTRQSIESQMLNAAKQAVTGEEPAMPFGMGFPSPTFYDEMVATGNRAVEIPAIHLSMMVDRHRSVFF